MSNNWSKCPILDAKNRVPIFMYKVTNNFKLILCDLQGLIMYWNEYLVTHCILKCPRYGGFTLLD